MIISKENRWLQIKVIKAKNKHNGKDIELVKNFKYLGVHIGHRNLIIVHVH